MPIKMLPDSNPTAAAAILGLQVAQEWAQDTMTGLKWGLIKM